MPTFTYTDQDNRPPHIPAGDYVLVIDRVTFGTTTKGDDKMDIQFQEPESGAIIFETMAFLPALGWKFDTFVKSFNLLLGGLPPKKGEPINYTVDMLEGLQGHASLFVDEYPVGSGKKKNKIATFLTDRPRLPKLQAAKDADDFDA